MSKDCSRSVLSPIYLQSHMCHLPLYDKCLRPTAFACLQEVALIGMLAYLSYLCGDWLGLSGIVALFCCAVTISHYALHNVSSLSRVTTVSAFQTLSYVSEGAIFIYVGMDTLDPVKWVSALRLAALLTRVWTAFERENMYC